MKKSVRALSILCGSLLLVSPMNATIFAEDFVTNNKVNVADVKEIETTKEEYTEVKSEDKDQVVLNSNKGQSDLDKDINNTVDTNTKLDTNANKVVDNNTNKDSEQETYIEVQKEEVKTQLTKDQAKQILVDRNPNVEYIYQGDENTFEVLKEKNLSGYVFLPNEEGDMGFLVDKNTSNIYYFHPSGYVEPVM